MHYCHGKEEIQERNLLTGFGFGCDDKLHFHLRDCCDGLIAGHYGRTTSWTHQSWHGPVVLTRIMCVSLVYTIPRHAFQPVFVLLGDS